MPRIVVQNLAGWANCRNGAEIPIPNKTPVKSPSSTANDFRPGGARRIVRGFLTVLAALWIFLEECVWNAMLACMAWLGKLPGIRWCERKIASLPPYASLIAFLIPAAVLIPFKLVAFWLIARGHGVLGLEVFVVAKVVGTAFLARIFALTKPALLTIGWFARLHARFGAWRDRLYAYVKSLPAWRAAKAWIEKTRAVLRGWYRSYFGK
jgi:hypothetical protein